MTRFKNRRSSADIEIDFDRIHPRDQKLMDDVYHIYGQYSAWKLRQMTHEEAPWQNSYARREGSPINNTQLREYFLTQTDEEYIQDYLSCEA